MSRSGLSFAAVSCAVVVAAALLTAQGPANEFKPDTTFTGSSLTGWSPLGAADWQAQAGEIVARPRADGQGGWLVLDKSYQDVNFFTRFRCTGTCQAGVLFRLRKTGAGITGVYVSLKDDDLKTYRITLDAEGRETARDALRPVAPFVRVAPPPAVADANAATPGRGGAGGFSMIGAGRGGGPVTLPTPLPELMPPAPGIRQSDWNLLSITMDANVIRPILNQSYDFIPGATDERDDYGPIALYAGGSGEVRFKDVSFKDLHVRHNTPEQVSSRFRMQRLDEFYHSWGATAADFNNDGVLDVVAGPHYYLGPAYTTRREIDIAPAQSPSASFARTMVDYAYDFTGDGWTDVLAGESRPMHLYVNPKGENRRWAKHSVLPQITSELALMRDIDGDGKPEIVFATGGVGGTLAFGWPDPANPTAPWPTHSISERGPVHGHGLGAGDVNGDARIDVLQAAGWWEQPAAGPRSGLWTYHPYAFGRWGRAEGAGGAEMVVFDVNGDRLNDVVGGLNAHGFGLAWFQQKRDSAGNITFERHMIIDDYSTKNTGGVTISEMHGATMADVDGDRIPDFVTGKRLFSHQESWVDPDPNGDAVLYWFRTVRNARAPGGAEFVPELIHNRSGVGSQVTATDLNKDGNVDIVTSTNRGTFIFWGQRRR
jgi:hypothetical protein